MVTETLQVGDYDVYSHYELDNDLHVYISNPEEGESKVWVFDGPSLQRYKEAGNIKNAVPFLHQDPDSDEILGQCEESGRDQGHATLCVSLMGAFCQMAYSIGEDLFAFDNYRAVAMAEYVGKYNLIKDEAFNKGTLVGDDFVYDSNSFPYTSYSNPSYTNTTISTDQRGTKRPAWELFYGYCKAKGISSIYSGKWAEQMRPDGGGGNYGPNSGGFDQLGFGTLMYYRE